MHIDIIAIMIQEYTSFYIKNRSEKYTWYPYAACTDA